MSPLDKIKQALRDRLESIDFENESDKTFNKKEFLADAKEVKKTFNEDLPQS